MNKRSIAYWLTTALTALGFLAGGLSDLLGAPEIVASLTHLGYPPYFATILGVWKVLGALAIVVPAQPRLKEWAYAGMFFDLTGAAASHAYAGDSASAMLIPLALLGVALASWSLRPASRTLAAPPDERIPQHTHGLARAS